MNFVGGERGGEDCLSVTTVFGNPIERAVKMRISDELRGGREK